MSDELLYEVRNHVGYITIDRPEKRNALSLDIVHALSDYLDDADNDDNARALCITGAGDRVFCAGADLGMMSGAKDEGKLQGVAAYAQLLAKMGKIGKPLVARVAGDCMAGGLGLMLSCDIVIAKNSVKFLSTGNKCRYMAHAGRCAPFQARSKETSLVPCLFRRKDYGERGEGTRYGDEGRRGRRVGR